MTDRLKEAREQTDVTRLAEWACGVLDIGVWRYDRKGWRDVARLGANKIIDLLRYIEMLEAEIKRLNEEAKDDD